MRGPWTCLLLAVIAGCGAANPGNKAPDSDVDGGLDAVSASGGACNAVVTHETPLQPASHVPQGAPLTFSSNPPSSGAHYPQPADWALEYPIVIDRGNYLHNEEHGGIAMLYDCPGGCQDVADGLAAIGQALPQDPACDGLDNGLGPVNARWLVTADPELPDGVQVAAAAWGWTYKADCLDPITLGEFIREHYAQGGSDRTNCKPPVDTGSGSGA
jgi:hypothetical protein|nr:DUF3105 domain-containing protein [Kofleriaceae bacterium]